MKKAFTLIELLVVIAIIAILAAILFPVFAQAKAAAKKTADLSNIKQNATAVLIYANDADDTPPVWTANNVYVFAARTLPYTKNKDIFKNPMSPFKWGTAQQKQGNNGFADYMSPPDDPCIGLPHSARGPKPNYYDDVYPPLDYTVNQSWADEYPCPSGSKEGSYKKTYNMTDGKIQNPAKVVMWVDFPIAGFEWPGGPYGSSANFWGTNFQGYHTGGSVVSHMDGHAAYYKFKKLYPVDGEGADSRQWWAWGFSWAPQEVQ